MEDRVVRSPIPIEVEWTDEEANLYQAIDSWQRTRAKQLKIPAGFAIQMPMRLASTCLPAARDRVLKLARAGSAPLDEIWEEDEYDDGDEAEVAGGFDDAPTTEVVDAARGSVTSTRSSIGSSRNSRRSSRKASESSVFTFSRPVVAYLHRRLSEYFRTEVVHGGIHKDLRGPLMRRFRNHEFDVLVASRVASEGLDFEFCSAVVNYDLPWNPMEVEQRIGRIDRFGQTEQKVFVLNFHTPGTIETDIVFRCSIGSACSRTRSASSIRSCGRCSRT
jgi:hypothetical protein